MSAQPEPKPRVSKGLLYTLAGVVVLALIGLFVLLPLMSGDAALEEPTVAVADPQATPAPEVEPTPEPSEELPPIVETFEVFSARDPFQQLVNESSDVVAVVGDPTVDGGTTATPTTGDPAVNTPSDSTSEDGTKVVVEDVFVEDDVDSVLLTANGTAYTLVEGDTFATNWRVEAIDDPCVTLLYGDQARLVCEGESIRK